MQDPFEDLQKHRKSDSSRANQLRNILAAMVNLNNQFGNKCPMWRMELGDWILVIGAALIKEREKFGRGRNKRHDKSKCK